MEKKQSKIKKALRAVDLPIFSAVLCEIILILGMICEKLYQTDAGHAARGIATFLYIGSFLVFLAVTALTALSSGSSLNSERDEDQNNTAHRTGKEKERWRTTVFLWILVVITMVIRLFV